MVRGGRALLLRCWPKASRARSAAGPRCWSRCSPRRGRAVLAVRTRPEATDGRHGFLLALAVMTFTPTKWTQHFGDLAGFGAAVLVLGAARRRGATVGRAGRGRGRRRRSWWRARTRGRSCRAWFTPTFSTLPPQVVGIPLATLLLVAGAVGRRRCGLVLAARDAAGARCVAVVLVVRAWCCRCWASPGSRRPPRQLHARLRRPRHPARRAVRAAAHAVGGDRPRGGAARHRPRRRCPSTSADHAARHRRRPAGHHGLVPVCAARACVVVTTAGTLRPGDTCGSTSAPTTPSTAITEAGDDAR